jgi:hypothetical protein
MSDQDKKAVVGKLSEQKLAGRRMPDPKSFNVKPIPLVDDGPAHGTVVDLDYEQWAPAIIDLGAKPERIETSRFRIQQRGYQQLEGDWRVVGFRAAEVWVVPRALYLEIMAGKRARLVAKVLAGSLSDQAITKPKVTYRAPNGVLIPI